MALICGCASAPITDPLTRTLGGSAPAERMEFWHQLNNRPVVSNTDALHALLLYLDDADPHPDYAARVAALKGRGLLDADFNRPADEAVNRGTVAVALVHLLDMKGGVTMRLFGASPRYAVRALQHQNLLPPSSPNQTFSGEEFVGVMGKAEDYQRGDPANYPAAYLPGEIEQGTAAQARFIPAPTDWRPDVEVPLAAPGGAPDGETGSLVRPLMLNIVSASAAAWWQDPAAATRGASPPQPTPTPGSPVHLKAIVTGVEGLAEVRKAEGEPWVAAKVGMLVSESAEFRTGPRSAVRFVIPPDHVYTLDRQGTMKVLTAVYDGQTVTTDVGMQRGRVRLDVAPIAAPLPPTAPGAAPGYRLERAGVRHSAAIRTPNTALAVQGTVVSLFDQAPFAPEAVSLTGRAQFLNTRRQLVAFGNAGQGRTVVRGDQSGPAENAYVRATISPTSETARNDFAAQEAALVLDRGGLIRGDVVVNFTPITNQELVPILPGFLNFVLRWNTPGQGNDLNLSVFSPVHLNPNPDFVANPPFFASLDPSDPSNKRLRRDSGQISAAEATDPPATGLYPRSSPSGGRIGRNHIGPAGVEVASWPRNYPVGTYQVIVYHTIDARNAASAPVDPVDYTVDVFLNGGLYASSPTLSVGQLRAGNPIPVRVPAPDQAPVAGADGATAAVGRRLADSANPPDFAGPRPIYPRRPGGSRASGSTQPPPRRTR